MSLQLLIDAAVRSGAIDAGALTARSQIAAAPVAPSSPDFGDQIQASFERLFPRPNTFRDGSTADGGQREPQRIKPAANPDFGDRVAEAFDRLFPPKGAHS